MKKGSDIDPDRWPDVSRVFSAAVDLDGPSRKAYLDDACGQDPALRAAVESLLGAHDDAGSFGDAPVFAPLGTEKRLAPGSQLGPFRIETWLGAGGMGEVYRAHDTKLQRAVAIKVLPDFFAQDPNRLARFEEEARALAALNHPHVGAIYGLEESAGIVALVLELVEGPTLAERLAAGPLAFEEVTWITRQLAEGLEAAHERGIVHRDLKPANIKITPDGNVKILDFGLAKTASSPPGAALASSTTSPRGATQVGVILGTVGYMSPEQARGQAVDKRTDIWAFGCVLFEMCAHQPPFAGATITDAQAAVIEREPDWELLRADTPRNLVRLLRRCLTKDPRLRLRDIGEARIALSPDAPAEDVPVRPGNRRVAAIAAILGLAALASVVAIAVYGPARSGSSAPPSTARFEVSPPERGKFWVDSGRTTFALSPDGLQLAFVATGGVWIRVLANAETRLLAASGNTGVYWSDDGQSLAFVTGPQLKRVNLADGVVLPICEAKDFRQVTWGARHVMLLGRYDGTSIDAVPETGGAPVALLHRNEAKGEAFVGWPWFLPDGKSFLYTVRLKDGEGEVRLARLRFGDDGKAQGVLLEEGPRTLISKSSNAQWVDPDVVVFVRDGVLMGQHVDVEAARTVAEPFPIADGVNFVLNTSRAAFSASRTGSVAYLPGRNTEQLVWADRNGKELGTVGGPADYEFLTARLSPDDRTVLAARRRAGLGTLDIWRIYVDRAQEQQLTSHRGNESSPVLIDGGRAIVYSADRDSSPPHLFRKDLVTEREEEIWPPGKQQRAMDVFRDGRVLYVEQSEMFLSPLARGTAPTHLPSGQLSVWKAQLSPDHGAVTFGTSSYTENMEVFVSTVHGTGAPQLVAKGVSGLARWSRNGRQLYYVTGGTMMARAVSNGPPLKLGPPVPLFKLARRSWLEDVFVDGRFLLRVPLRPVDEIPIVVWTNAITSTQR